MLLLLGGCQRPSDTGTLVYRHVDGVALSMKVFAPPDTAKGAALAAIVVFHGGAWYGGDPTVAHPICRYFALRGMVCAAATYRLSDEAEVTPIEALEDAREALAWMRRSAVRLGVDPARIAAAGWSSGGHMAAMAAISEEEGRHRPDALVLWFPAVAPHTHPDFLRLLQDRVDPASLAPVELVRAGLPPTIILQGSRDRVTPLSAARRFCREMETAGNRCDLHVYKNRGHVLFHDLADYVDVVVKADRFLQSIGFLEGRADAETARRLKVESLADSRQETTGAPGS